MANFFRSVLSSARAILQNKTVTSTTSVQVITPDSGYDGLAQVTVNPQSHSGSTSYTTNGQKDLGANHNTRYVNINVPTSSGYNYGWDSATTLWTNSSPTSSFSGQDVSFSSMSNYRYLRFTFRINTSNSTTFTVIIPYSDFVNSSAPSTSGYNYSVSSMKGSYALSRRFYYASATSVHFFAAQYIGAGGGAQDYLIPTKIEGLR